MLFGVVTGTALLWSYVIGLISDRLNRLTALALGLAIATVGYSGMGLIADPFSGSAIPVAMLLGMGEISVLIAAGVLVGQDAPIQIRGTIIGVFAIMGSAGITFATFVGGIAFDRIAPSAPFVMMGLLNGALLIAAVWLRRKE